MSMKTLGCIEVLDDSALEKMRSRALYYNDLTPIQKEEFTAGYSDEISRGTTDMSGKYHQAFLGSIHGLIGSGAWKVKKSTPGFPTTGIYEYDDCLHDGILLLSAERCLKYLTELQNETGHRPLTSWVIGRAWSEARRKDNMHGGPSVLYPSNTPRVRILNRLVEIDSLSQKSGLNDAQYEKSVMESGLRLNSERPDLYCKIGCAIWVFANAESATPETITDDLAYESRLLVDSDMCDDEILGATNEQPDMRDYYLWDDTFDNVANNNLVDSLRWDLLSDIQRDILNKRFGLGNQNRSPQTLQEIGDSLKLTRERIRQIQNTALKILLDPDEFLQKKVGVIKTKSIIEISEDSLNKLGHIVRKRLLSWSIDLNDCAVATGTTEQQLEKWITGSGINTASRNKLAEYFDMSDDEIKEVFSATSDKNSSKKSDSRCEEVNVRSSFSRALLQRITAGTPLDDHEKTLIQQLLI
jgi:hypothetical protein